jgi:hypothetical protein
MNLCLIPNVRNSTHVVTLLFLNGVRPTWAVRSQPSEQCTKTDVLWFSTLSTIRTAPAKMHLMCFSQYVDSTPVSHRNSSIFGKHNSERISTLISGRKPWTDKMLHFKITLTGTFLYFQVQEKTLAMTMFQISEDNNLWSCTFGGPISKYSSSVGFGGLTAVVTSDDIFCDIFFFKPNLFAICSSAFSKWLVMWDMACRRVLSSTPLLVRGSGTGVASGFVIYKL